MSAIKPTYFQKINSWLIIFFGLPVLYRFFHAIPFMTRKEWAIQSNYIAFGICFFILVVLAGLKLRYPNRLFINHCGYSTLLKITLLAGFYLLLAYSVVFTVRETFTVSYTQYYGTQYEASILVKERYSIDHANNICRGRQIISDAAVFDYTLLNSFCISGLSKKIDVFPSQILIRGKETHFGLTIDKYFIENKSLSSSEVKAIESNNPVYRQ